MSWDEDDLCPQCGHPSASHFGDEGYGCDDCPGEECGPSLDGVDAVVTPD